MTTTARATVQELLDAMQGGDTTTMADLLAPGYTLTHMTGYRQPGEEWLREMGQGQFIYHHIRVERWKEAVHADDVTITVETTADATVHGHRNHWPLRLVHQVVRHGSRWSIAATVASTW